MKNFKEMLDKDLDRTFYNTEEFAELQRVRIDGIDRNVPVIFDSDAAEARRQMLSGDHAQGIYQKLLVVRIRLSDLEKEPRQGMRMWIGSELYKISEVTTEYNELIIELVGTLKYHRKPPTGYTLFYPAWEKRTKKY